MQVSRLVRGQHSASLLEATSHDVRARRGQPVDRLAPASVGCCPRRHCGSSVPGHSETSHVGRNLSRNLADVERQPLAPKGFSNDERHRLRRAHKPMEPSSYAVVGLLLETGLRRPSGSTLCVSRSPRDRSGWEDVVGKCSKDRPVALNAAVRDGVIAIQLEGDPHWGRCCAASRPRAGRSKTNADAAVGLKELAPALQVVRPGHIVVQFGVPSRLRMVARWWGFRSRSSGRGQASL